MTQVHALLRSVVPRPARRAVSVQLARLRSARLRRTLAALAAGNRSIVAGPWLGEVGFELLYWVPFLRWFAETFAVARSRLVVVSRGGTASWYQPFAEGYVEILDTVSPDEFRHQHDRRVLDIGEQKQRRTTRFERELLDRATGAAHADGVEVLHPSLMYEVMNPFWWQHLDEEWVHAHTRYARLSAPAAPAAGPLPSSYVAVKFYFNESFPASDRNRRFVAGLVRELALRSPVVSLTFGLALDDHGGLDVGGHGITTLPADLDPRCNLQVQSAVVAGARAFVGTYGGFSYLAPLLGIGTLAFYSHPSGFRFDHLEVAKRVFSGLRCGAFVELDTRAIDVVKLGFSGALRSLVEG